MSKQSNCKIILKYALKELHLQELKDELKLFRVFPMSDGEKCHQLNKWRWNYRDSFWKICFKQERFPWNRFLLGAHQLKVSELCSLSIWPWMRFYVQLFLMDYRTDFLCRVKNGLKMGQTLHRVTDIGERMKQKTNYEQIAVNEIIMSHHTITICYNWVQSHTQSEMTAITDDDSVVMCSV